MGKPMGNGYPIGGVAVRREVADAFASSGIEYFNTYGGNSVACAVGEAVLDAIEEDKMQSNALLVGNYTKSALMGLKNAYPHVVGDVRGMGLFLGVEFIHPSSTPEKIYPDMGVCKWVVDELKRSKIITSRDGPDGNVLKVRKPGDVANGGYRAEKARWPCSDRVALVVLLYKASLLPISGR